VLADDVLDTMHANAHEPIVIGAARRYELSGESVFASIAENFHEVLTTEHAYSTGNGNHGEYWAAPGRLGDTLDGDTQESCTSYNLLKLDKHLMSWQDAASDASLNYAEHYERLFTNGIMSTMDSSRVGALIYMLPLATVNGSSKGFGDPLYSMTCCYGTGIETHAKLGDTIFAHQDSGAASGAPTFAVIQYHSATATWSPPGATFTITQTVEWNDISLTLSVTLNVVVSGATSAPTATVQLRVPSWVDASAGGSLAVNGVAVNGSPFPPLTWALVSRAWSLGTGDTVTAFFPIAPVRLEYVKDDRAEYDNTVAVLSGPFMLVAPSVHGSALAGDASKPASWIAPVSAAKRNALASLAAGGGGAGFFVRHDENDLAPEGMGMSVGAVDPTRDTQGPDASFIVTSPGLSGVVGSASIEAANWPGFYVCACRGTTPGSPLVLIDPGVMVNNATAADCSFAQHSPGLSGVNGSLSFELLTRAGSFVSWFGGGGALTVQPLKAGDANFANMTSWLPVAPVWTFPSFSFVAEPTAAARSSGATRAFLLYPIAFAVTETYVAHFQIV
jgi:uncharacterized protein